MRYYWENKEDTLELVEDNVSFHQMGKEKWDFLQCHSETRVCPAAGLRTAAAWRRSGIQVRKGKSEHLLGFAKKCKAAL